MPNPVLVAADATRSLFQDSTGTLVTMQGVDTISARDFLLGGPLLGRKLEATHGRLRLGATRERAP